MYGDVAALYRYAGPATWGRPRYGGAQADQHSVGSGPNVTQVADLVLPDGTWSMITHSAAYGTKFVQGGPLLVYLFYGGSGFGGPVKTVLANGDFFTKRQDNGQCYRWSSSGYTTVASC